MPPYSVSCIDDSDDVVILPRGNTTGRFANNLTRGERPEPINDKRPNATVAYVANGKGQKTHSLSRPETKPAKLDSLIDDSSEMADREAIEKKLKAKVEKIRETGRVKSEDGKYHYDLHLIRGGKTYSLLDSAIDDSNSVMKEVTSERANLPSVKSKQTNMQQERTGPSSHAVPVAVQSNGRLGKQKPKPTLADHVGGVPCQTAPRKSDILVAHTLTKEERAAIDAPKPLVLAKYASSRKMPRFGILIKCDDGRIRLVQNADGPVLTCVGTEARPDTVAHSRTPAAVTPSNYQAPTVESVSDSDSSDLAGLFD